MAVPKIKYAIGNSASTTISSGVTGSSTSFPLTSDTNFQAKSGAGMVIMDEGQATEEYGYATTVGGGALTIPLANRGLEGGSAQAHTSGTSIKGILSATMWNDLVDAVLNILDQTAGTVKSFTLPSSGQISVNSANPKRAFYVPASGMFGATTNGAATGQIETTTNKINIKTLDFDASTEEYAWFCLPAPSYYDLSTITAEFHWTAASGSGDVIWGIAGLARSNDDALDTALGTAVTVTDTLITANDEHLTSDTSACTIAGTPAKDDLLTFRIFRKAADGSDTLGVDARLLGVTIRFGVSQFDDQ